MGGRSPLGVDCSSFSNSIPITGIDLPEVRHQQAKVGTTLSFVEESEPGDLAFFVDKGVL